MKNLFYVLGGLALLLFAVYLGGRAYADYRLDDLIARANEDGNRLTIGERDLSFSLLYAGVELDSVYLEQTAGNQHLTGSIAHLEVSGLSVIGLLSGKLSLSELTLDGPELVLRPAATPADTTRATKEQKTINVAALRIRSGRLDRYDTEGEVTAQVMGVTTDGSFQFPLAPATAPTLKITADSISFPGKEHSDRTLSHVALDTEARSLRIRTFRVAPRQTARALLTSLRYKTTWQAVRIDDVVLDDLPLDSLLTGGRAILPRLSIGDLNLVIYENPELERHPNEPNKSFPVENFRKLGRPLLLQNLSVDRVNIAYGNLKEGSPQPDITFAGSLRGGNFSTWRQQEPAFVEADFMFEQTSPLKVRFDLGQAEDGRDFTAVGELRDYDLTKVNPLMIVAAGADIESGHLNRMTHNFSAANEVARGELVFEYEKLELKMEGKGAWLLNMFEDLVIRDSNPRNDGELVTGTVYAEHDQTRSFFNLYWKSLVAGMTSSVAGKTVLPGDLKPTE